MTKNNVPSDNFRISTAAALLILAVAVLAVYAVSLKNGFVLDDEIIIVNNPQTLSLQSIPDVLFAPDEIKPYYRPLNRATYLLDYQLFGMNPAAFHAVGIFIHIGTAFLVYLLGCRLLPGRGAALFAALLFAVHPVNSEAVNFVSTRNTLLACFFSLAALLAFLRARERQARWPLLAAALFFCGLLSKETAFMLIAVIAVILAVPFQPTAGVSKEPWSARFRMLLPFVLAAAVYLCMRTYSLQGVVAAQPSVLPLLSRLAQNLFIIPQYLALFLVPSDLTIFHRVVPIKGLLAMPGVVPAVWAALLAGVWMLLRRGERSVQFGLVWLALNYLPIANLVPIPSNPITERFLYLPGVGMFLLAGAGFGWLMARERLRFLTLAAGVVVLLSYAAVTVQRNLEWRDDLSLFRSGVSKDPASVEAQSNYGTALRDNGQLTEAGRAWQKALELDPAHADTLSQMGTLAAVRGDLAVAENYYRAALAAPPGKGDPGKVMVHYNLGKIYDRQGRPTLALQHYEQYLRNLGSDYREYRPEVEERVARLRTVLPVTGR